MVGRRIRPVAKTICWSRRCSRTSPPIDRPACPYDAPARPPATISAAPPTISSALQSRICPASRLRLHRHRDGDACRRRAASPSPLLAGTAREAGQTRMAARWNSSPTVPAVRRARPGARPLGHRDAHRASPCASSSSFPEGVKGLHNAGVLKPAAGASYWGRRGMAVRRLALAWPVSGLRSRAACLPA